MKSGIDWQPIAIVPSVCKDGPHLLLWQDEAFIGCWVTDAGHAAWATANYRIIQPTHWADIDPPR